MKNVKYTYARGKLGLAIRIMAVGSGDVRERLRHAYREFHPLSEKDFPDDLKSDWRWIYSQITKFVPRMDHDGKVWQGSVDNTLSRIRNSTGTKIAEKLYDLNWNLRENEYL